MKKFKFLTKQIVMLFTAIISITVVVFIGVMLYINVPNIFSSEKEIAKEWKPRIVNKEIAEASVSEEVKYGYKLLTETQKYIGPQADNPEMRFSGNNLRCTNCHLQEGNKAGSGSWAGVTQRYPSFRGRSNAMGTIEDRINGCMERSMNGKKLEKSSKEMHGMVTYMEWLSEGIPKDSVKPISGFTNLEIPDVAVNLEKGKDVFTKQCITCHKADGQGMKNDDFKNGYLYPPLWGEDSFNDGAGMHRVITSAQFIKANMPYLVASRENPVLTDEEAYNVAGYINSFKRPEKTNKEADFPDKKLKPVSTPYGPWADDFSQQQHQFGPFPPIIAYYKEKYDIKKSK